MPDVSKLSLDGTSYDIKDDAARKYLVVVNNTSQDATKVNITTSDDEIELALQSDLDVVEEETAYLKNVITSDGVWVFIGDSFFTNNYNPATKIASFLGKTYGTDIIVTAKGGAGFSHPADDIVFLTLLQNLVVSDNNAVTKVFFCGGTNDIFSGTQTTLIGAVQTACKQAHVKFPYAEVYVVNTESWINEDYSWALRDSLNRYYQQGAARGGAKYLGAVGVECKLYASSMMNDDLMHPTDAGYQSIAQQILVNMSGLGYSEGYGTTNTNIGFKMEDDKIYVRWHSNYTAVLSSTIASLVPNSGTGIDIPITNCVIKQNSDTKDFFDTYGAVKVNGSFIPCRLKGQFTFTGIKVFPWLVEGSGSPTWTNITQVVIPAGTTAILTAHCTM